MSDLQKPRHISTLPDRDDPKRQRRRQLSPIPAFAAYFALSKADTGEPAAPACAFVVARPCMADPIDMNRRNWDERATIHASNATGFYSLQFFPCAQPPFLVIVPATHHP